MRKWIITWIVCMTAWMLRAQDADTLSYHLGYTSTATFNNTNNSRSYLMNNAIAFNIDKERIGLTSTGKWLYGRMESELTNNDLFSELFMDVLKTKDRRFYYWCLISYTSAYSLRVHHQLQAGAGVAYFLFRRDAFTVNISDGILYEYSDVQTSDISREEYSTPRNSFRLQIKSNLNDRFVFRATGFLQNSLADLSDYIIKSDISLSFKIRRWISITGALNYNEMTRTHTSSLFMTYGFMLEHNF